MNSDSFNRFIPEFGKTQNKIGEFKEIRLRRLEE